MSGKRPGAGAGGSSSSGFGGSGLPGGSDLRPPGSLAAAGATSVVKGGLGPKAKAAGEEGVGIGGAGGISRPTNVQRVVHVEWDSKTGTVRSGRWEGLHTTRWC